MAFTIPSREDIFQAFIGDYATAQPTKNVSRGSDPYRLGRVVSGVVWVIGAKLLFVVKQALPDSAKGYFLDRWGAVFNFPRLQPSGSAGINALTVTGTVAAAVPAGSQLAHADGTLYAVTSVGSVIGAGGTVLVSVAATSAGAATNKGVGEVLTFTGLPAPLAGVNAATTVVVPLTGGIDLESDELYAPRLLAHIGDPPEGGSIADYREWALSVPGALTAYVWRHRRGTGTIDVAVLGNGVGAARVLSDLSPFTAYIEARRPANVKDWKMLVTVPQAQDVTASILIDTTLYKWDWDDLGVGYVITAYDPAGITITVPAAPASVVAGVRLQVNGEEALVTQRAGSVLTLSFAAPPVTSWNPNPVAPAWFAAALTAGVSTIRCSGDLIVPARTAVLSLFANLGPARSSYSAFTWDDSVRYSKLYAAITDLDGVIDATLTVPAGNVSPVDTFGTTIPFLAPGIVQVLKQ
jgi:uncharacterized phage protein gp47/JayE